MWRFTMEWRSLAYEHASTNKVVPCLPSSGLSWLLRATQVLKTYAMYKLAMMMRFICCSKVIWNTLSCCANLRPVEFCWNSKTSLGPGASMAFELKLWVPFVLLSHEYGRLKQQHWANWWKAQRLASIFREAGTVFSHEWHCWWKTGTSITQRS